MSLLDYISLRSKLSAVGELLREIPLFSELTSSELGLVERIAHERSYGSGEAVFHAGDPGIGLYIIKRGHICIVSKDPESLLSELFDGDFFGEIALLNETSRSATARAKSSTTVLAFFKADLFQLMEDNPRLGMRVLSALSRIVGDRLVKANAFIDMCSEASNVNDGSSSQIIGTLDRNEHTDGHDGDSNDISSEGR